MENRNIIYTVVLFIVLICVVLGVSILRSLPDGKMHVIFCDVGQGDATYIKFPDGTDMLIDGGPNAKVLECLGKYMTFYDRRIEIVAMTHPHHDHYAGLFDVVSRYEVGVFLAPPVDNNNKSFGNLKKLIVEKNIEIRNLYQSDEIILNKNIIQCTKYIKSNHKKCEQSARITVLWPEYDWTLKNLENRYEKAPGGVLGASSATGELNDFSLVFWVSYDDYDVLMTGDIEAKLLEQAIKEHEVAKHTDFEVLKVPHHGSFGAVSTVLLSNITPEVGVIMVGEKNRYGHPHKSVEKLLKEHNVEVLRTDREGDIVLKN